MTGHRKENKTPYKIRGTRPWQKRAHLEQLGVLIDEMAEWPLADLEAEQARLKRKLTHEEGITVEEYNRLHAIKAAMVAREHRHGTTH